MAEALKRALTMPKAERIDRWQRLMDGVRKTDVRTWRDAFVSALKATRQPGADQATPVSELPVATRGWRGVQAFDLARQAQVRDQRPPGRPRGPVTDRGA